MATNVSQRQKRSGQAKAAAMNERQIKEIVERVLQEKLSAVLADVSWRMRQLYEGSEKVPAEGLNLAHHLITGYTVTNNSPTAGSIAWSDLHVVYQGTDYGPFAGNTNLKYVWFDYDNATNKIQTSNTKPTLAKEDALLFINDNGTAITVLGASMTHGAAILTGTVDSGEIKDGAVIAAKILDGAVGSTKIAPSAVGSTQLANNAVSGTKIAAGAVDGTKIASDAVDSAHIKNNAVSGTKISAGAVDGTKIASGAVGSSHIAVGAVGNSQLASAAVDGSKIATGAVGSGHLANAAVTAIKLAGGAVSADKLNLLIHTIY